MKSASVFASVLRPLPSLSVAALAFAAGTAGWAEDYPQWRGPGRNGVSEARGLLREWPKEGPALVWKSTECGSGYSTPAVVGDRIYLLGNDGLEDESLRALSAADGKRLWITRLGKVGKPQQKPNFPGARSTPTVVGDAIYALGSDGDLACVNLADGKIRWQKNLRTEFGGRSGIWAYSESPLIDGNTVVVTPGGTNATVVALDKASGAVKWQFTAAEGDEAGYASAIVVNHGNTKQYVQLLQKGLVGLDAATGRQLWRWNKAVSKYGANIPTPLADNGIIYASSAGTGGGAIRLKNEGGETRFEELYFESKLPTTIGGTVKVGNHAYGTTGQALLCFEFATGKVLWEDRSIGTSSLVLVDGLLVLHGENGEVALVEPSPESYKERGRFTPPDAPKKAGPMEKAWAHPVIANGRLYLRDHALLWAYAVK